MAEGVKFSRRAAEKLIRDYQQRHQHGPGERNPGGPSNNRWCGWMWGVVLGAVHSGVFSTTFNGGSKAAVEWLVVELWTPDTSSSEPGGALLQIATGPVTTVAAGSPAVITSAAHGLTENDVIAITGSVALNGVWRVANVTTNTFTLQGTPAQSNGVSDGSDVTAGASSGGTWTVAQYVVNRSSGLAGVAPADCKIEFGYQEWSPSWIDC